ncbi:MAG: NAD(P)/FAD-dependent oxidoreductase [Bacteroidales bacterium]|nr:NAD(P)/FAD-dependent oxidoreductase [Bacteroidales bacterium]
MAKVAIIGGGVSGLAAGIYAQMSGLESEIYEKHIVVGGQCTSWKRQGFHIDNCVHWMTGTNPKTDIYKVWEDVGVLGKDKAILKHDFFMEVNIDGKKAHVWRNPEKMREELLLLAPEDTEEINQFIDAIKNFQALQIPALKPSEQRNLWDNLKIVFKMLKAIPVAAKFGKLSLDDYAKRFKNPVIQQIIYNYLPKEYYVLATFFMYSMFTSDNADLPLGGSDMITNRMRDRYLALGGKISCKKQVSNLVVENRKVTKIKFEDQTETTADFVISATDPDVTFKILGENYMDDLFKKWYADKQNYPIFSEINIYFAFDCPTDKLPSMELFNCEPYEIAGNKHSIIITNNYADEPNFAPEGKSLMQILIVQNEDDFEYWNRLYNENRTEYKAAKERIINEIQQRLELHYPEYSGKISAVEMVTPKSFNRFTGAYKGSYMGFIQTPHVKKENHPGILPGLDNFYLAGQWLQTPGGLPNALIIGRFAIQRLLKQENLLHTFCSRRI